MTFYRGDRVVEWAAVTDKGLERPKNEDGFLALPELGLFAVADGLGGHLAGEVASRVALESFAAAMQTHTGGDFQAVLADAAGFANRVVYGLAQSNPEYSNMGTTLTACLIRSRELFWVHVGDSRGYLIRKNAIEQFTKDHSFLAEVLLEGQEQGEKMQAHPYRHVLTRALGTEAVVAADTGRFPLEPGDTILLCTDGLTLHLNEEDILAVLSQGVVSQQAEELVGLALGRGGRDNVTVILIKITE